METEVNATSERVTTATGRFMTVADAVKNCNVQSKRTIIRWAQAEGLKETYGRTKNYSVERVVPVEWIQGKMRERDINGEAYFEAVDLLDQVDFSGGLKNTEENSNLPTLNEIPPEFIALLEKLKTVYETHSEETSKLFSQTRQQITRMENQVQHQQKESQDEFGRIKKSQKWHNIMMGTGVALLAIAVVFIINLIFQVNARQVEEGIKIEAGVTRQMDNISTTLSENLQVLKDNERRKETEISRLQETIVLLQEQLTKAIGQSEAVIEQKNNLINELKDEKARLEKDF